MLEELGRDRYEDTLSFHNALVRSVLAVHGGIEVDRHGDADDDRRQGIGVGERDIDGSRAVGPSDGRRLAAPGGRRGRRDG